MEDRLASENNKLQLGKVVEPDYTIRFFKDEKQIGVVDFTDNTVKFEGNVAKSAKLFFEAINGLVQNKIKSAVQPNIKKKII
jgi:hypothetical protein